MRVWLYCFIVYIKILSYSRQSLLTKQQIRLEVTIISQQVYIMFTSKTLTKDRPMQRPIRPPTLEIRLAHVNPYKKAFKKRQRYFQTSSKIYFFTYGDGMKATTCARFSLQ